MTTFKGIAAATQTFRYLLETAIRDAVPEAQVTMKRPEEPSAGAADDPRLNLYLFLVQPEPTMRSSDLPTRENGRLVHEPQAPVNLRYLLSFFGPWEKAHLMLGATEVALRARPVLDAELIGQALQAHPDLQDAQLAEQQPPPRVVPANVTLDDLSKFWSGFLHTPYTLSIVYDVGTVILTATTGEVVPGIPVRHVDVDVASPTLERPR